MAIHAGETLSLLSDPSSMEYPPAKLGLGWLRIVYEYGHEGETQSF